MRAALSAVSILLLAGCGGGSGSSVAVSSPPPAPSFMPAIVTMSHASASSVSGVVPGAVHAVTVAAISQAPDQSHVNFARGLPTATLSVTTGAAMQNTMRSPVGFSNAKAFPVEADALAVARMRERASNLRPAGPAARTGLPRIRSLPTLLGAAANIWVEKFALGTSDVQNVQVPAMLAAITDHGYLWIDQALLSGAGALDQNAIATLAADFENAYASDLVHFGSPHYPPTAPGVNAAFHTCDSNGIVQPGTAMAAVVPEGDQHINFVVLSSLGAGVGGYFDPANYFPQPIANCFGIPGDPNSIGVSNGGAFFFIAWFGAVNGADYELRENFVKGTAHELQHMINFINHSVISPNGFALFAATGHGDLGFEDAFINEGLSMLSQDFAIDRMFPGQIYDVDQALGRAFVFLGAPQNYSLSGFIGTEPNATSPHYNCHFGCYGSAYLFARYLYNRFGGDSFTTAMETSGVEGFANLQRNGGNEDASSIIADFATAIAAASAGVSGDPRFSFAPLSLTQTYRNQFGGTLTLSGVTPADGLTAGTARSYTVPLGGFIYFRSTMLPPGGFNVTIGDTTGTFGLTGALVEQ